MPPKFTLTDVFAILFWLLIVFILSYRTIFKNKEEHPYYKYYGWGLSLKIAGGFFITLIYMFYYGGGDTFEYFHGTEVIVNMASKDFGTFIRLLIGENTPELRSLFDKDTGYTYYFSNPNTFSVCRFMVPFFLLGFKSLWGTLIAMNYLLFYTSWGFFKMLNEMYPNMEKYMAISLFYFPSVFVWSSGIFKDSWCLSAIFIIYTLFWKIFFKKEYRLLFIIIFWMYILLSIRPFMFYAIIASTIIWISFHHLQNIKNNLLRIFLFPFLLSIAVLISTTLITRSSIFAEGKYSSVDKLIEQAWIIQDDLSKEYYGGNSFDIGDFEPSIIGIIQKSPQAIIAGMFRPFIWESISVLMLFSALESTFLIMFFLYTLIRMKLINTIRNVVKDPFILSALCFCIVIAFMVGLTAANFGALVRYRIPAIPFLACSLFITINLYKKDTIL